MIEASFPALLMPAIRTAPLSETCYVAATQAAVALPAITMRTNPEHSETFAAQTNPLPQHHFARNRHARSQAGLDNGNGFVAALEPA